MRDRQSLCVNSIPSLFTTVLASLALVAAVGCSTTTGRAPEVQPAGPVVPAVGDQGTGGDAVTAPVGDAADTPATVGDSDHYYVRCGGRVVSLEQVLAPIIDDLLGQGNTSGIGEPGIPYATDPADELRDCSGNFLRVSSALADRCPAHADTLAAGAGVEPWAPDGDNVFTGRINARDSRSTARWYHDQGLFTPIFCEGDTTKLSTDMSANADKIKPGAVIWYAHSGECITRDEGLEKLLSRINHVGTVRSVERDESGTVVAYEIYHGRSTGRGSGVDRLERVYSGSTRGIPPYGNWREPVVGIAPIVPTQ